MSQDELREFYYLQEYDICRQSDEVYYGRPYGWRTVLTLNSGLSSNPTINEVYGNKIMSEGYRREIPYGVYLKCYKDFAISYPSNTMDPKLRNALIDAHHCFNNISKGVHGGARR